MTDKKLIDEEIIETMERCSKGEGCFGCAKAYMHSANCIRILQAECLDLITRQKTENENLKVENQSLRSAANSLKMHYEKAQAEIERLKTNLNVELDNFASEYDEKIKAKAYKEFAERLKERIYKGGVHPTIEDEFMCDIDNLVKEMAGE